MTSIAGHILKRGFEAHDIYCKGKTHHGMPHGMAQHQDQPHDQPESPFTPAMVFCMVLTALIFTLIFSMNEYTYGHLIPTLAMVETPTAVLVESITPDEKEGASEKEPMLEPHEAVLIPPITTSVFATLIHLRSIGGRLSSFRGLPLFILHCLSLDHLSLLFSLLLPLPLAAILAATLLANVRMGWTHIVVSFPSPLPWYRRLPSSKLFKAVAGPTALVALAEQLTIGLPMLLWRALGLNRAMHAHAAGKMDGTHEGCAAMMKAAGVVVVGLVLATFVLLPLTAVLARIQASLLDKAEDTVVTVNRDEDMGVKEAWKSFDWNAWARVAMTYAKYVATQVGIMVLFVVAVYGQLVLFLGPEFYKVLGEMLVARA